MYNQSKRVTEILGSKYPLIQAPMNWLTNAALVAAVSNAGGFGVLGPNAGQSSLNDVDQTYATFRAEIQKTKQLTDKNFGVNLVLPMNPFAEAILRAAFDEDIRYYAIVGEIDEDLFARIKARQGIIIYRPLNATRENMQAAEKLGVDVLVATGYDEGGVIPSQQIGTFTIVPAMVDAVSIPVLAAGGINDARGVKAAFALGASGVYIGTRFLMTQESPMHAAVKARVLEAENQEMLLVAKQQRSLNTDIAMSLAEHYLNDATSDQNMARIREKGGVRSGMLEGDLVNGIVSLNTGISVIQDIPTVAELIETLMN